MSLNTHVTSDKSFLKVQRFAILCCHRRGNAEIVSHRLLMLIGARLRFGNKVEGKAAIT